MNEKNVDKSNIVLALGGSCKGQVKPGLLPLVVEFWRNGLWGNGTVIGCIKGFAIPYSIPVPVSVEFVDDLDDVTNVPNDSILDV